MSWQYARILRAMSARSGVMHYAAITTSGRKQNFYLRSDVLLSEGESIRVTERGGEWVLA